MAGGGLPIILPGPTRHGVWLDRVEEAGIKRLSGPVTLPACVSMMVMMVLEIQSFIDLIEAFIEYFMYQILV